MNQNKGGEVLAGDALGSLLCVRNAMACRDFPKSMCYYFLLHLPKVSVPKWWSQNTKPELSDPTAMLSDSLLCCSIQREGNKNMGEMM